MRSVIRELLIHRSFALSLQMQTKINIVENHRNIKLEIFEYLNFILLLAVHRSFGLSLQMQTEINIVGDHRNKMLKIIVYLNFILLLAELIVDKDVKSLC